MTRKYISRQESTLGRRRSNVPSLACAFSAAATTGGTIYAFGVFANDLKRALQLTQMQLGAISAALFIAGFFSWIPGIVVDRMKMRFSMATGGISGAFFIMLYWAVSRFPNGIFHLTHPVPVLAVFSICISLSCGLIIGSVFKLTMLCGGRDGKGAAVGIAKGFTGLGSGIYATIFQAFRDDTESTLDFLPVIAFFFILCATLPALLLLPPADQTHPHLMKIETTPLHFRIMYLCLGVLCVFILGSATYDIWIDATTTDNVVGRQFGKCAIFLLLWLGPIVSLVFLPRKEERQWHHESEEVPTFLTPLKGDDTTTSPTTMGAEENSDEDEDDEEANEEEKQAIMQSWRVLHEEEEEHHVSYQKQVHSPPKPNHNIVVDFRIDLSLPEMLQTPSAWLMLWTTLILVGSGTAKTNNMGQLVESLGFSDVVTPATLAIFAVAQSASRIITGIGSEEAMKSGVRLPSFCNFGNHAGIPRPFFLVVASVIALFAHVLLAFSTNLVLFVLGNALTAIAFGMAWPLMVLIVSDLYGFEHHGANYLFYDGGTKALGTLFLSTYVSGTVYETHVDTTIGDGLTCYGAHCFQEAHMAIVGLSITCIIASFLLCYTSRHAYD